MKFTLIINQAGVVRLGLLGQVDLPALCVLDYLSGWFFCAKAKRAVVEGREFVWVRYEHAVEELPLLFNPQATVETRKNQLSRLVQNLRHAGLVESMKVGRDLYLRPSDLAASLASSRERIATKSAPTVMPTKDDTVTRLDDDSVSSKRDGSAPAIIDQTTSNQSNIKEAIPHSPPSGDGDCSTTNKLSSQAELIYSVYPKQVGKPAALRAIRRAISLQTFEVVLERTRLYAATYNGEPRFMPNPSTFFNQARYMDDPATWRRASSTSGRVQPSRQFQDKNYRQPTSEF